MYTVELCLLCRQMLCKYADMGDSKNQSLVHWLLLPGPPAQVHY